MDMGTIAGSLGTLVLFSTVIVLVFREIDRLGLVEAIKDFENGEMLVRAEELRK